MQSTYQSKKLVGALTTTLLSTAPPDADTLPTAAAVLSSTGNIQTLTLTPNPAATDCSWSIDGDILRAV